MSQPLLSVCNLSVSFEGKEGRIPVLKDLCFTLNSREIFALVGQSGSGKSTAVKAILGLLGENAQVSGQVLYKGEDLLEPTGQVVAKLRWVDLAIVMQSALNALNPLLRIGGHFRDTLRQHGLMDEGEILNRTRTLLEKVQLEPRVMDCYPHELSGGMRQRVCIALALVLEPELVVLDECTTALDVLVEGEVLKALLSLQAEMGFAVLAISHDLPLLAEFAEQLGVLSKGELVENRPMSEFLSAPKHPESQALIADLPCSDGPFQADLLVRIPVVNPAPLLQVTGLSKRYRDQQVLDDVSFSVGQGESVALVGASGSGKSTIARLIARLTPADRGEIQLNGERLKPGSTACSKHYRASLQMVFQDPFSSLNPAHTVATHLFRALRRGPKALGTLRDQSCALLEQVELIPAPDFLDRFPHELSGGQRQRVAIARCLALAPQLLICDEPTSMLDLPLRISLLRTLNRLREERNMGILLITHDLAATRYFSDRILVLDHGKIVETGKTGEVLHTPQSAVTQRLVAAAARHSIQRND
jgi:peptide/nickel transport system ATP-binding protein